MYRIFVYDPQWNFTNGSLYDTYEMKRALTRAKNMSAKEYNGGVVVVRAHSYMESAFYLGKEVPVEKFEETVAAAMNQWNPDNQIGAYLWGLSSSGKWVEIKGKEKMSLAGEPVKEETIWFNQALALSRAKQTYGAYNTYKIRRSADNNRDRYFNLGVEITAEQADRIIENSIVQYAEQKIETTVRERLLSVSPVLFGNAATPEKSLEKLLGSLNEAVKYLESTQSMLGGLASWADTSENSLLSASTLDSDRLWMQQKQEELRQLIREVTERSSRLTDERLSK